jgi:hypothetical protein
VEGLPTVPRRLWVGGTVVLALALAFGGWLWWRSRDDTAFAGAVERAPAGSQRLSWTDWAAIRAHEHEPLSSTSSQGDLQRFLGRAYDDDLSSTSALVTSAPVLQRRFGFSPADADWELFSQSAQGAVVMLHLPKADLGRVAGDLARLGYRRPAQSDGMWSGGTDLLARISAGLTPELAYVAIDTHDSLILTSDTAAYLELAVRAATGHGDRVSGLSGVVEDAGEPLSSAVYSGDYACGALAMAHAGADDQAAAARLVTAAGTVNPYSAFAMSDEPGGSVRVSFEFSDDASARANADSRARLAAGPAPGQGGSFSDRFSVDEVTAHGTLVSMRLSPRRDASVLSDLSTGPLLFATC